VPEIPEIGVDRVWVNAPVLSIPAAPPVTHNIGVPVIDMPGFDPMDFRPEKLVADPPPVLPNPPPAPPAPPAPTPITPKLPQPAFDQDPRCPPLRAKKVGTLVGDGERIAGYEIREGECKVLYESIPLPEQVAKAVPSLAEVTPVAITAMVGVSAGLATPLLLKAVKPAVKKIAKKIQGLLGRKGEPVSVFERRQAQRLARK